jgi:hypothetical protein
MDMPDDKGNLYLFEAIELRNVYDRRIKLMEELTEGDDDRSDGLFRNREEDEKEPATGFDPKKIEGELKRLKVKRIKLNQEIQAANFKYRIDHNGESISIAEALEIRKNLLDDIKSISQRAVSSAYKRIIYKEKRDIVKSPKQPFEKVYDNYIDIIEKIRTIITRIHIANHNSIVSFKDQ